MGTKCIGHADISSDGHVVRMTYMDAPLGVSLPQTAPCQTSAENSPFVSPGKIAEVHSTAALARFSKYQKRHQAPENLVRSDGI